MDNNKILVGQVWGPFTANANVIDIINQKESANGCTLTEIFKIGIFCQPESLLKIQTENSGNPLKEIRIGKTGMLEVKDSDVKAISFNTTTDSLAHVSYAAIYAKINN